jgi:PLP dependent protein
MNHEEILNNYLKIKTNIEKIEQENGREKGSVKLIPVSKTKPVEMMIEVSKLGINLFGESYAQELKSKYNYFVEQGVNQPVWHYIGHLQRNKAKYIVPFSSMIHAVDSLRLAQEISKQTRNSGRENIDILLQINTSNEDSKFGINPDETENIIYDILNIKNINLCGFMTIAGLESTEEETKNEFLLLKEIRDFNSNKIGKEMPELSMGMSGDYHLAISCGSTMVRVGSSIFGERNYKT